MFKGKILVIEDSKTQAKYLSNNLPNYNLRITSNGNEAIRLLKADTPDLILLDLNLPDIDGLELCRLFKKDIRYKTYLL